MRLAGYLYILGIYTLAYSVAEYSGKPHLTAPSAVHLTTCFLPHSQQRGLSVKASLPLSPLQRVIILLIALYSAILTLSIGKANFLTSKSFQFLTNGNHKRFTHSSPSKTLKYGYVYGQLYMTYTVPRPIYHTGQTDKNSFPSYQPATKRYCFQGCFCQF